MAWTAVITYAVGDPWTAAAVNTYLRDNLNYLADSSGQMHPTGANHYFGANAAGGAGTRVHLGSLGDANSAYVEAESSGTNANLILRSQGTSNTASNIIFQTAAAVTLGQFTANPAAGNTSLNVNVSGVGDQIVSLGAADSGGVGFRLLRVPN